MLSVPAILPIRNRRAGEEGAFDLTRMFRRKSCSCMALRFRVPLILELSPGAMGWRGYFSRTQLHEAWTYVSTNGAFPVLAKRNSKSFSPSFLFIVPKSTQVRSNVIAGIKSSVSRGSSPCTAAINVIRNMIKKDTRLVIIFILSHSNTIICFSEIKRNLSIVCFKSHSITQFIWTESIKYKQRYLKYFNYENFGKI